MKFIGWKPFTDLKQIIMLKIENIGSSEVHSDAWRMGRLAKFTSSMIYTLMGKIPFTDGATTYIYEKVGESLTGTPAKEEVETEATRWGLHWENHAIKKFGQLKGVDFLVVQKLISIPGSMFGSTPDAIWVKKLFDDGYDVETAEIKCYPSYGHYIECALCATPEQLKSVDKKLYWQVIDQMENCNCLNGNAVLFHPLFKSGGFRVIPFRKINLIPDFKLLKERKESAIIKFNEIRDKLMNIKN